VLRMHGTSLRALTACGVPEELVAAVLLFLASPGAKVYMDKHRHRVRDVGHSAIALPDGKGFLVEQQARGGAYAPGTVLGVKDALSFWCVRALLLCACVLSCVRPGTSATTCPTRAQITRSSRSSLRA